MKITTKLFVFVFACWGLAFSGLAQANLTCWDDFQEGVITLSEENRIDESNLNLPIASEFETYQFTIINTGQKEHLLSFVVEDPTIPFVRISLFQDSNWVVIGEGGLKALTRNKNHINLNFSANFFLGISSYPQFFRITVHQKPTQKDFRIIVAQEKEIAQYATRNFFLLGVYYGIFLIIFIYTLFSFFSFKQGYFMWFAWFVFLLGVRVSIRTSVISYLFDISNPQVYLDVNTLTSTLIFIVFIRFLQLFIDIKTKFPVLNKLLFAIIAIRVFITLTIFAFTQQNLQLLEVYSRVGLLISLLIGLYVSVAGSKINKNFSKVIIAAFIFLIIAGFIGVFFDVNILSLNAQTIGLWLVMVLVQTLLFLGAISIQVNQLAKEHTLLGERMRKTKKDLVKAYVTGVRSEKMKVSKELQLLVLDKLAIIKQEFNPHLETELTESLGQIEDDIIHISDELSVGTEISFIDEVQRLVNQHQMPNTSFRFKSSNCTVEIPSSTQNHLYRIIQETIQNIEKYAHASLVEIQLYQRKNELFLTIEDNGVGFDSTSNTQGIGLINIESRIQELGGKFTLNTSPNQGVSILIQIPINDD